VNLTTTSGDNANTWQCVTRFPVGNTYVDCLLTRREGCQSDGYGQLPLNKQRWRRLSVVRPGPRSMVLTLLELLSAPARQFGTPQMQYTYTLLTCYSFPASQPSHHHIGVQFRIPQSSRVYAIRNRCAGPTCARANQTWHILDKFF
jgi:hypothetical protein